MGAFDDSLGVVSVAYVLAAMLFGMLNIQSFRYFEGFSKDRLTIKLLVGGVWILNVLQMVFIGHSLYHWMISNFGNPAAFNSSIWSFDVGILFTNIIVLAVELFFAFRVLTLSKNKWLSGIIAILSVCYWGFELASFVRKFQLGKISLFFRFEWIACTGLACAAAADLLIAGSLTFYLRQGRTGVRKTDSVINKLMMYAINTGLLTSIFAVIDMICFLTMPHNLIHDAMNIMVGKLYTISLLASLNVRANLRSSLNAESTGCNMSNFNAPEASRSGAAAGASPPIFAVVGAGSELAGVEIPKYFDFDRSSSTMPMVKLNESKISRCITQV
ncbi:hypothetical protein BDP27DRAFT_461824 [Rhodocollybia butyracea]|uniref:DUF6534 domain-containing protein n=1 Tax=Rhodocollybia butyracea TaxID=206335 RepID=A0A9P5UB86_9AGAR|nr:hypothetical protein BDP27DRAFT_461824 [Rhodocollybia butyracea]